MKLSSTIEIFAGGAGSGCDPTVAEQHGEHCGRPPSESTAQDKVKFDTLKKRWANVNNELLEYIDKPDAPQVQAKMDELHSIVKQMHQLNADPGGVEGIGLPGGPRDVLVIGAGPGGLQSGIMGATEGLDTLVVEANTKVGGQAKYSSRIENFAGFPVGVSGQKMAETFYSQAERLGAEFKLGVRAISVEYDPVTGMKTVTLSNGDKIQTRAVVLAGGIEFRKMEFPGSESEDVVYANGDMVAKKAAGQTAVIVGGSNGAAQAALGVARTAQHVYLLSRGPIEKGMSDYQVQALRNNSKVSVVEGDEVARLFLDEQGHASAVATKNGHLFPTRAVGIFIGGASKTDWLPKDVKIKDGKIVVDSNLETGMPGVFAIGDMRQGSVGRIGAAVGDAQVAVKHLFDYFPRMPKRRVKAMAAAALKQHGKKTAGKLIDKMFQFDREHPMPLSQYVEQKPVKRGRL